MSAQITEIRGHKRKHTRREEGEQSREHGSQISRRGGIGGERLDEVTILECPDRNQAHGIRQQQDADRNDEHTTGDLEIFLIGSHALEPAVGAVLMSVSTIVVAINAQLLRRAEL